MGHLKFQNLERHTTDVIHFHGNVMITTKTRCYAKQ